MTVPPWGPPIDVLPLLAREEQALVGLLSGVGRDEWTAPAAGGATVHELIARVLGSKLARLSRDRDQHRVGDPGTFDAHWVPATRQLSPEVLFALLVDSTAQLTELWKHRDLDEPLDDAPAWLVLARDYAGFWVRQQQVREAVGAPLLDDRELRTPVVDTFLRALPEALRSVPARTGRQVACAVEGAGRWTVRSTGDGWTIAPGAATSRSPLASMTTDADTFWRLCTGENVRDRLRTTGDPEVCDAVLSLRAGL
ncbi:maleylpyruvate isomerase family mycothiol-dependent enzyme [Amycolatopsis ultiminotia]|uniref:Maleylpyruvate isomerase family mycothiol-dependent enzyme n=2 Tax=Amycolatopsis ultiminotia TaxID=543629 RepID=A0ABP6WY43_9PSEU